MRTVGRPGKNHMYPVFAWSYKGGSMQRQYAHRSELYAKEALCGFTGHDGKEKDMGPLFVMFISYIKFDQALILRRSRVLIRDRQTGPCYFFKVGGIKKQAFSIVVQIILILPAIHTKLIYC